MKNLEKSFFQIWIFLILVLFLWTAVDILRYPYGMDYGEAQLMDQIHRIENKQVLYKNNLEAPPYIIANYPPLYHVAVALFNYLTKIPLFSSGRMVSFFFSIVCCVIIGSFSYQLTGEKLLGVLGSALFIGHPYVMVWSALARVDIMALSFSLLGLWIIYRKWRSIKWTALAIVCFIISGYTRQTYIFAGPFAAAVWLWANNRRRSLFFLITFIGSILLIFGTINAITHEGFYTNIIMANINPYSVTLALMMWKKFLVIWPFILISAVCFLIWVIYKRVTNKTIISMSSSNQAFSLYGLGFFSIGAFLSSLTVGKIGSDVNYFLELIAAGAISSILAIYLVRQGPKLLKNIFLGMLTLQLIWVLVGSFIINRSSINDHWTKIAEMNNLYEQVKLASQKGIVLSDNYIDLVVLSGQPIYYQPFEYTQLYDAGLWNPSDLARKISEKSFPLILTGSETVGSGCCWPPLLVNALETYYQKTSAEDVVVYTPKN